MLFVHSNLMKNFNENSEVAYFFGPPCKLPSHST